MTLRTLQLQGRKPLLGQMPDESHLARQGLICHLLTNEGGGGIVYDSSGRGFKGTLTGSAKWAEGDSIECLTSGAGYVSVGNVGITLNTATLWFKPNATITTSSSTIGLMAINNSGDWRGIFMGNSTGNFTDELIEVRTDNGVSGSGYTKSGGTISAEWHFLAIVWSSTQSRYRIYLDGVRVDNASYGTNSVLTANNIEFGRNRSSGSRVYLDGRVRNMRVYNRVLTESEILELYWNPYPEYTDRLWVGGVAAGGAALTRVLSEAQYLNESAGRRSGVNRIVDESQYIPEGLLRTLFLRRILVENQNIIESSGRRSALGRTVSEVIHIGEVIVRRSGLSRVVSEVIHIGEGVIKQVSTAITRVISEAIHIAESLGTLTGFVRTISETVQMIEAKVKAFSLRRVISEAIQTIETLVTTRTLVRILAEALHIVETVIRTAGILRVINEALHSIETVLRVSGFVRVITETVRILETTARSLILSGIERVTKLFIKSKRMTIFSLEESKRQAIFQLDRMIRIFKK